MIDKNTNRNYMLDNLKAFLIFLVVFSHMLLTYKYDEINEYISIVKFIYVFHMPLFFMISGELSKKTNKKRIKIYVLLFFLMQVTFQLYDYYLYGSFSFFNIEYSSWFLLLLVLYRFIFSNNIIKKVFDYKYSVYITFVIVLLTGFIPTNLIVLRFFYFFVFFLIGYKVDNIIHKKHFILILPLIVFFTLMISSVSRLDLLMGDSYINYWEIIIRFIVICIDIILYYLLKIFIIDKKIPLITKVGYSSLYIYVLHRIPTLVLSDYLYIHKSYILISLIISVVICLVITYLSKYIKMFFQSKALYICIIILFVIYVLLYYSSHHYPL